MAGRELRMCFKQSCEAVVFMLAVSGCREKHGFEGDSCGVEMWEESRMMSQCQAWADGQMVVPFSDLEV